jgi:hypothetical protein
MKRLPFRNYQLRADRLRKAIADAQDGKERAGLESAESTALTIAALIGWGKTEIKSGSGDNDDQKREWVEWAAMTKAERTDLLKRVVKKLDEAATMLNLVEERLLREQVREVADLIHVEIEEAENAEAA